MNEKEIVKLIEDCKKVSEQVLELLDNDLAEIKRLREDIEIEYPFMKDFKR